MAGYFLKSLKNKAAFTSSIQRHMKKYIVLLGWVLPGFAFAQNRVYAEKIADAIMKKYPDSMVVKKMASHLMQDNQLKPGQNADEVNRTIEANWNYEMGVIMMGFDRLWRASGNEGYYRYMKHIVGKFISAQGDIKNYHYEDYNADNIPAGRQLLTIYRKENEQQYRLAADQLEKQVNWQPRNKAGGLWHKLKYPMQMWLDGLYMFQPFHAEYAMLYNKQENFADIARQFTIMEQHARDAGTGLLYHGWDESRLQKWANPATGNSPEFWSRAMGWYMMGLVDVLDYFPKKHPQRAGLIGILNRLAKAIVQYQDAGSGVWWQVTDKAGKPGNYLESSASAMFVYGMAKGIRLGYLPKSYLVSMNKGMNGLIKQFVETDAQGAVHYTKAVSGAGLGGIPYRDGTYAYYTSEPKRDDDLKAIGPFMQACIEVDEVNRMKAGVVKK